MTTTDDAILAAILRREGGFVNHPADRGGPTHYGITQATLQAWRGRAVSEEDVRALSVEEAKAIYRAR
jgi:lysozyme family protein